MRSDGRLVQRLVKELDVETAKAVATPAVRYDLKVASLSEQPLDATASRLFRKCTGVLMCMAFRRVDLQFASKEVAKGMASPTELDLLRLRRAAKYLRDRPQGELRFE